jgi:hypothetical protein
MARERVVLPAPEGAVKMMGKPRRFNDIIIFNIPYHLQNCQVHTPSSIKKEGSGAAFPETAMEALRREPMANHLHDLIILCR